MHGRRYEAGGTEQCRNWRFLAVANLDHQMARRFEQLWRLSRNGAIAAESVGAAVERAARIVTHLGGQQCDLGACDVGRVADDQIEGACESCAEITGGEHRARGKAEATG